MEATVTKGHGVIRISAKPLMLESLGNPVTVEEWQKALMLPDEYEVVHTYHNAQAQVFELGIESEYIPVRSEITATEVTPYYNRIDDKAVLTRIVIKQWDSEHWVEVKS